MKPTITINRGCFKYTHPTPELLSMLTNERVVMKEVPSDSSPYPRVERVIEQEPLYTHAGSSVVIFSGLLPRVRRYLDMSGVSYDVVDRREPPPSVDLSRISKFTLRHGQGHAIAAVATMPNGVIHLPTANGKTFVAGLLAEIYRGVCPLLIVSESSSVLRAILSQVQNLSTSRAYILNKDSEMNPSVDCIVCSSKSLHKVDPLWPRLVIYDEVHSSAAPVTSRRLTRFSQARMFGFSATPFGRSDNSDLVMEAIFGPVRVKVSYESAVRAGSVTPIRVYMLPVPHGGAGASKLKSDVARDRNGIWRNSVRNRIIAQIANDIPKDQQVLIIGATTEHILRLKKLLPDCALAHGGMTKDKWSRFVSQGLINKNDGPEIWKPNVKQLEIDFREGRVRRVLSTGVWKEGVDFPDLVFVVRVDGKRGNIPSIQIGGRLSRKGSSLDKKMGVLFDFDDSFDRLFEGRAKVRAKSYRKEGWDVRYEWPDFNKLMTDM